LILTLRRKKEKLEENKNSVFSNKGREQENAAF